MRLPHDLFLLLRKEAYIEELQATPEGREYLRTAERLQQTEPDYAALARLPGYTKEVTIDGGSA